MVQVYNSVKFECVSFPQGSLSGLDTFAEGRSAPSWTMDLFARREIPLPPAFDLKNAG
jgi:hypothetical protein